MTNLNKASIRPWLKINSIAIVFLIFSVLGFIDATYLAIKFYTNTIPPCSFIDGCEEVTTSSYAAIGGVSIALMGSIYYVIIFLSSIFYLDTKNEKILYWLSYFTIIGFIASVYWTAVQLFDLKALCIYCLFSAGNSTILFIAGRIYARSRLIESGQK